VGRFWTMLGADLSRILELKKWGVLGVFRCRLIGWYWKDDGCIVIIDWPE